MACGVGAAVVTYFVVLPSVMNEDGDLEPGEAQDRQSASSAICVAQIRPSGTEAKVLRTLGEAPFLDDVVVG